MIPGSAAGERLSRSTWTWWPRGGGSRVGPVGTGTVGAVEPAEDSTRLGSGGWWAGIAWGGSRGPS